MSALSPGVGSAAVLPEPDAAAAAHSARVVEQITDVVRAGGGWIDFSDYMRLALYAPGLGYYTAGAHKFGAGGDFVTAPEISPLFGACMASQLQRWLAQGCAPRLLEFGAGSGRLCRDLLACAGEIESYLILETSADLRQRQREFLQQQLSTELFHKIEWLERLPDGFDGIVLANEVLDAMPVHLLEKDEHWQTLGVGLDGKALVWRRRAAEGETLAAILAIEDEVGALPDGYRCEINPNLGPWFAALGAACNEAALLLIDYGYPRQLYYHPERLRGTLTCHYRHRVHEDALFYPGLQDITAFVDFDACADAAESAGFDLCGLVNQAQFLFANGLLERAGVAMEAADERQRLSLAQQVKTLTLPEEMGEKFRVLALSKNIEIDFGPAAGGWPG